MKRLILSVRSQDGERVDEIVFSYGDVLIRNQGSSPLVAVSSIVGARFEDDEAAERAKAARRRLTAVYPDNDHQRKAVHD